MGYYLTFGGFETAYGGLGGDHNCWDIGLFSTRGTALNCDFSIFNTWTVFKIATNNEIALILRELQRVQEGWKEITPAGMWFLSPHNEDPPLRTSHPRLLDF